MARTISQLAEGTEIYLDETVSGTTTHTPYIYLGQDESNNCLVLRMHPPLAKRMHSSNVASYDGCEADVWMENESTGFLSRFDAATINALNYTSITYTDYTKSEGGTVEYLTITRRCFALSYTNLGYGGTAEGKSFLPALLAYYNTTTANTARIGRSADNTAVYWWLRSASSSTYFRLVNAGGSANASNASSGGIWQRPALSFAPDTPVSDEGAETIFLLPDGRRTTWSINAIAPVGASAVRPAQVKLVVAETGIASATYYVSNNAGDASPVWVEIQNGGVATLANTSKETSDWQLAVKIIAESNTASGHVGEPALITLHDAA